MSEEVWWYATRAAGLMTWSTAVASVIVGLLLSTRVIKNRTGPWLLDLHRFLGGITVLFLLVHMGTLYFDSFVDFGPRELLIPGESTWNTEAAAWGVIAAWTLVLVEVTSLLRKHISQSVWRTVHMLSVVTVVAGSYHAWLGGTDVDNPLTYVIAGAGSAIVVALVAVRLKGSDQPSSPRVAKANDREALLAEMRDRLESLPVPENTAQPELTEDGGALPRRAPVAVATPDVEEEAAPVDAFGAAPAAPAAAAPSMPAFPASPADPFGGDEPFDPFNPTSAPPAAMPGVHPTAAPEFPEPAPPAPPAPPPAPVGYDDIAIAGRAAPDPFGRGHAEPAAAPTPEMPAASPFETPPPLPQRNPAAPVQHGETPVAPQAAPFFEPTPPPGSHADTPFPAQSPFAEQPAPAEPPFDPNSPFGSEAPPAVPVQPTPEPPMAPLQQPADADLFAPATAAEEQAALRADDAFPELSEPTSNPFQPAEAATPAISVPVQHDGQTPTPAPAAMPIAEERPAPPPLPTAVDPSTGEPDQAAYTAWLVEWLAYAEKYGEETPDDPNRTF